VEAKAASTVEAKTTKRKIVQNHQNQELVKMANRSQVRAFPDRCLWNCLLQSMGEWCSV
jgi:hypothetical protein